MGAIFFNGVQEGAYTFCQTATRRSSAKVAIPGILGLRRPE